MPPSDGYLCHKQILSTTALPDIPCKDINADTITDIQVCSRAAQEMGINYASTAGPEWTGGCIVNGGQAYFSDPEVLGSRNRIPDKGSICLQRQQMIVTSLDVKSGLRDEQLVVDEQEKKRLWELEQQRLAEEKKRLWELEQQQEKVVSKTLMTEETTTFQEAPRLKTEEELVKTRFDESSYAAIDDGSRVLTKEDFAKMEQENLNLVKEIRPHLAWGGLCDVNECAEWCVLGCVCPPAHRSQILSPHRISPLIPCSPLSQTHTCRKCPTWCFCFQAFPFFESAWDSLPNKCPSDGEECDCHPSIEAEIDGFQPDLHPSHYDELIRNPMGPFKFVKPVRSRCASERVVC